MRYERSRVSTRKILVASIGVTSISYVVACERTPQPTPSGPAEAGRAWVDDGSGGGVVSGNLVAPMPSDASPPRRPTPRDAGPEAADCDVPYTVDNQGRKQYKPQCL